MTQRSDSKLWALDALVRDDGSLRVGFLIHADSPMQPGFHGPVKLPAFLWGKMYSWMPAVPLAQIVMMASAGMTPQHTIAFAGPEPEETEERRIGGRRLRVSTLFR